MAENEPELHQHEEHREPPKPYHETSDVDVFVIGRFGVAMVAIIIACMVLMFGLFRYMESTTGGTKAPVLEHGPLSKLPPEPRLEETPILDLANFIGQQEQALNSYGWVDQKAGVVHIPIDRAIDLLAQRGLPARQTAGPQSSAAGVSAPSESGLGQKAQPPGGPLGDVK